MQSGFGSETSNRENPESPRYIIYSANTDRNNVQNVVYMDTAYPEENYSQLFAPDGTEMVPGQEYCFGETVYRFGQTVSSPGEVECVNRPEERVMGQVQPLAAYAPNPDPRPNQIETDTGVTVTLHCYFDAPQPRVVVCGGNGQPISNKETNAGPVRVEGINSLDELPEVLQTLILNQGHYPKD